jgi:CheY-like chemotaxis protein
VRPIPERYDLGLPVVALEQEWRGPQGFRHFPSPSELQWEGHEVTVVRDGGEALSAWPTSLPEVALLDIGMPGLSGYEVARAVRKSEHGGAVLLIAITGWGQTRDKVEALAAGFGHHFTKPIDMDRLRELLGSTASAAGSSTVTR